MRYSARVEAHAKAEGAGCVLIAAKIEAELALLPRKPSERRFSIRSRLPSPAFTGSSARAMLCSISSPSSPPGPRKRAPGRWRRAPRRRKPRASIHTDFEKGFIRAETIAYDDYVALGGEQGARDAGKMRLEGKDYVVQDGDVMHFRFAT